jgi:hypothetical protein
MQGIIVMLTKFLDINVHGKLMASRGEREGETPMADVWDKVFL